MFNAYGVDVLAPGMSMRRFWVLWDRLPPSTRVKPGVENCWSQEAYLLAAIADGITHLDYVTRQVYSKKKLDMPKPLDRPAELAAKAGHEQPTTVQQDRPSPWRSILRKLRGGEVTPRGR
jgi:hypothetical protein